MSLEHTLPESFIGVVIGFDGVSDGYTAVHGPTGCKFYPSSAAEDMYVHTSSSLPRSRNPLTLGSVYFFAQPRVPCTYLDMDTFVNGASFRLKDMMSQIDRINPSVIGLVNSPGASLVGEDLTAVKSAHPVAVVEHAEYSGTLADGFQDAVLALLKAVPPERKGARKGVNLVGLAISHLRWKDTLDDLSSLLDLCGVKVNRCIGSGWSVKDIRESADAELNVAVYPEYADRICGFYERELGVPGYICPNGAPIGFTALESWIKGVCEHLGADPSPALSRIKTKRRAAAEALLSLESRHSLPKGRTFSVMCDGSAAYAVSEFLYSYLGMIPVAVKCQNGKSWEDALRKRMMGAHGVPVSDDPEDTTTDVLISSGPVCSSAVERGTALEGYAIEYPSPDMVTIDPAPVLGLGGTVKLLEKVLDTVAKHHRFR